MIPLAVPSFYNHFPEWLKIVLHSGITFGSLMAVILNVLLNGYGNETHVVQKTRREKAIARLDKWKEERKVRRNQSI
jgi:xanthine permease